MLGYAGQGTARVKVEAIVPSDFSAAPPVRREVVPSSVVEAAPAERQKIAEGKGREFLQVGAFSSLEAARKLVARLNTFITQPVSIQSDTAQNGNVLHKVRIGPLSDALSAEEIIDGVQSAGLGTPF